MIIPSLESAPNPDEHRKGEEGVARALETMIPGNCGRRPPPCSVPREAICGTLLLVSAEQHLSTQARSAFIGIGQGLLRHGNLK